MKPSSRKYRGAFVILDVMTGLFLFAVMSSVLAIALAAQARGASRLSDSRTALRAAQVALMQMQAGETAPQSIGAATIDVRDETIGSAHWVRVRANFRGHSASLIGLVREEHR